MLRRADQPFDLEMGKGGTQVHYLATGTGTNGNFGLAEWAVTGQRPDDEVRAKFMLEHDTYWLDD